MNRYKIYIKKTIQNCIKSFSTLYKCISEMLLFAVYIHYVIFYVLNIGQFFLNFFVRYNPLNTYKKLYIHFLCIILINVTKKLLVLILGILITIFFNSPNRKRQDIRYIQFSTQSFVSHKNND